LKRRLSTTDDDPIEKSDPCFQEPEKDLFTDKIMTNFLDFFWQYKFAIVAVSTAEIASCGKNYRSDFARIIEKRGFFYSRKEHTLKRKNKKAERIKTEGSPWRKEFLFFPSFPSTTGG
jgi:hypothetical protein